MIEEKTVLAIDTSSSLCSIALVEGGRDRRLLGSFSITGLAHSRRLLQSVEKLMGELGFDWQGLDGIAVALGPGSFTGLRIGIATVKGLATAAGLPVVGVSSLRIAAASVAIRPQQEICAVLDARKKEVYAGCYVFSDERLIAQGEKMVLAPAELAVRLSSDFLLVGDGAMLYHDLFKQIIGEKVCIAPAWSNQANAVVLGFLGIDLLNAGKVLDISSFPPCYVRKSDAELNLER